MTLPRTRGRAVEHAIAEGEDLKGDRGGDTGNTTQKGKGEKAEKGDQRRPDNFTHDGPTRSGTDHSSRSGSDSNES